MVTSDMRFPLILTALACLFTSCQRNTAENGVCREMLGKMYTSMGWDKHAFTSYQQSDKHTDGDQDYYLMVTTVDLARTGNTVNANFRCDLINGKYYLSPLYSN